MMVNLGLVFHQEYTTLSYTDGGSYIKGRIGFVVTYHDSKASSEVAKLHPFYNFTSYISHKLKNAEISRMFSVIHFYDFTGYTSKSLYDS